MKAAAPGSGLRALRVAPDAAPVPRNAPLGRLADGVARMRGWRRWGLAVLLGIAATAAFPPLHILPALAVAFTGLVWLIEASPSARSALAAGWWFGFGHFASGVYWVALALATDPGRYGFMVPVAPLALAAYLALYPAGAAWLAWLSRRPRGVASGPALVVAFAIAWTVMEWLRGHLLTGFPWNLVATVWADWPAMLQFAAVGGGYGLGLLTVLAFSMPAVLARSSPRRAAGPLVAAGLILGALGIAGALRLAAAGSPPPEMPGIEIEIVQASIAQDHKWREELRASHLRRHLDMTATVRSSAGPGGRSPVTFVVWPETAVPFLIERDAKLRAMIAAAVPQGGLIITGAPRAQEDESGGIRFWNSILALDARGEVVGAYDKFHLVPFGEYLPLRSFIPRALQFDKITAGSSDFSTGPGPRTLHLPGLPPVSPLICYEIIFPGEVVDPADRPAMLLNVTNDAWFGVSSGPYQHFASARLRAVEEGLPVVRAANTGISGVIDPYGRVLDRLGLGDRGVIRSSLPAALAPPPYGRWGDRMLALLIAVAGGGLAARRAAGFPRLR